MGAANDWQVSLFTEPISSLIFHAMGEEEMPLGYPRNTQVRCTFTQPLQVFLEFSTL
jgi:hypothetical protein